jgi:urease gamma subunit
MMRLTPRELEKLPIYVIAEVARRRRDRGVKLNYEEADALICEMILEGARDGKSVAELMTRGKLVVSLDECMEGVDALLEIVQMEATFPDGTKLVSVLNPLIPPTPEELEELESERKDVPDGHA